MGGDAAPEDGLVVLDHVPVGMLRAAPRELQHLHAQQQANAGEAHEQRLAAGDAQCQHAKAGGQGFLLKDAEPEQLQDAIRRVAAGETLLQPVATDAVRARYRFHDEDVPADTFSKREVAVLRLMAGGYSNREIAGSLFLAEGTVKNYVSTILEKLGTRDRTRAVLKAITLRII